MSMTVFVAVSSSSLLSWFFAGPSCRSPRIQTLHRPRRSSWRPMLRQLKSDRRRHSTSGRIAHPKLGTTYELCYQIRLHSRAGNEGPLLGDREMPGGRAFPIVN